MYYLNDPPLPYLLNFYAFFSVLILALVLALWRPWHRSWRFERTGWFVGTILYSLGAFAISAKTPYLYPNVGVFGGLIWLVALLAFLLGMFQKLSLDPTVVYTKRADLVLAMTCCFVLFYLLVPTLGHPAEASNRTQCKNNLKQIMLAHQNNNDFHLRFAASSEGVPPHSWRVTLLPFMDQKPVFDQYRFAVPWDDSANLPVATTPMTIFQCPSRVKQVSPEFLRDAQQRYFSHYAMLKGAHTAGTGVTVNQITDGTSNTLLVVEACGVDRVWTNPTDVDIDSQPIGINLPSAARFHSPGWISSHHYDGGHVALVDGSVRFLSKNIDPKVLKALVTMDGGERVGDF